MMTSRTREAQYVSMSGRIAWRSSFLATLALVVATTTGLCEQLVAGESARAVEIVDGDTLVLDSGKQVRLVGLQAPKLPLGRPDFTAWPLSEDAAAALRELSLGKTLSLVYGGRRKDRHGRILAHLYDESGSWIQGAMLQRGMARVYSFSDNRSLVAEMLAIERQARAARRGIWADPYYGVRGHREMHRYTDSFQLVEGRIHAVSSIRGWTYVNFEEDWRHDFTISVRRGNLKEFLRAGLDPATLEGRRVRVRGWIRWFNGPAIESTHPEQIELLE